MNADPALRGKFCWQCYNESIARVAATLPRPLRTALLAAAQEHRHDGFPVSTAEHARHSVTLLLPAEKEPG